MAQEREQPRAGRWGATATLVLGFPVAAWFFMGGFGLELVILWRGYGNARWPPGDTFRWISPSGEDVIAVHLPRDGYEFGSHLPSES